jgi:hypothetical protein
LAPTQVLKNWPLAIWTNVKKSKFSLKTNVMLIVVFKYVAATGARIANY